MNSWNKRNGQRATVKRPGTKEYSANYKNSTKQFFEKRTRAGCTSCGSTQVRLVGGNGRLFVYCKNCGKQLKVINTKPLKVGNWSKTKIYRTRAGLCTICGHAHFTGKMHLSADCKHYNITMTCNSCGASSGIHRV